jgi:hypothetical protein
VGVAAPEQLLEPTVERRLERSERGGELVRDHRVELGDQLAGAVDRLAQVGLLGFERFEAALQRGVLVDGEGICRAELVVATPKRGEPARRGRLVGRRDCRPTIGDRRKRVFERGRFVRIVGFAFKHIGRGRLCFRVVGFGLCPEASQAELPEAG